MLDRETTRPRLALHRPAGALHAVVVAAVASAVADPAAHARPHDPSPPSLPVPAALLPWVPWVLHGEEAALCPPLQGADDDSARPCLWPARLSLVLDDRGGRFQQQLEVRGKPQPVPLPGDARHWPMAVTVDGRAAVVLADSDERPVVWLSPGAHALAGAMAWDEAPEALRVPPSTGLVALTMRGRPVPLPTRDAEGRLWLERQADEGGGGPKSDLLEIAVHRRVIDDIPLSLRTVLTLRVAGKSREVVLGRALPAGFVPLSLGGDLPARLEPDGRVRVQVRPGTFSLELLARHEGPASALTRPPPDGPWKEGDEVWVFEAHPELRLVTVEGVSAIDPQQTTLPDEWKKLPTYAVPEGATLRLTELRRGDAEPRPDELRLQRELWLDFDGRGYTASDRVSGRLGRSFRLEALPSTELGRVAVDGQDQFITGGAGGRAGVELRRGALALEADSRLPGGSALWATGWDADFRQASTTLFVPPGWRLLAAAGVDEASGSWVGRWSLLDLFVVLVAALAAGRLLGWRSGGLALAALLGSFVEPAAPRWLWLSLLGAEALLRLVPAGRGQAALRFGRTLVRLALVLAALDFAADQAGRGLHPALDAEGEEGDGVWPASWLLGSRARPAAPAIGETDRAVDRFEKALMPPSSAPAERGRDEEPRGDGMAVLGAGKPEGRMGKMSSPSKPSPPRQYVVEYDTNQVVQTGPGLPRWRFHPVTLRWNGPVERGQRLRLFLLPPWANALLALLRVALVAALLLRLLAGPDGRAPPWWPGRRPSLAPMVALLVLPLSLAAPLRVARAELPPKELLDELKARLLQPPACRPSCASISLLSLDAAPALLRLRLSVDAAAATGVPLPGGAEQWTAAEVLLDGRPAPALRTEEGKLWLAMPPGSHQVTLAGPLPARDTVQIALPLLPHRVEARTAGWRLDGLHEDGISDEDLQLTRLQAEGPARGPGALQPGALPPFVQVERRLELGLVWQVETKVVRRSPTGSAVVIEVPLLPGESVTSAEVRVVDGRALVNMGASASEVSWRSLLQQRPELRLLAAEHQPFTELWQLSPSPIWHVEARGLPVIHELDDQGARRPLWRPWPGEALTLTISRPEGIGGQTLTIDGSQLTARPGLRATDVHLSFELRASRGGRHRITLPEGAVLQALTVSGLSQPARQDGRQVLLTVSPGAQTIALDWRQPDGIALVFRAPTVDLGVPSVNVEQRIELGDGRWVLLLGGPRLGPAVRFWSLLLVIAAAALGLARSGLAPLGVGAWLLLGLGLSQVALPLLAVVVGWLLALGWRGRRPEAEPTARGRRLFNLRQVLLGAWTLLALLILGLAVSEGLLGAPQMQIEGHGSQALSLRWFSDRAGAALPRPWVLSLPLSLYRAAMLAWALWLAPSLLAWLRWGLESCSRGGLWRARPPGPPPAAPPPAAGPAEPPPLGDPPLAG